MIPSTDQRSFQGNSIVRQGDHIVLEMDAALSRLQDDHELFAEQTKLFLEFCPDLLLNLVRAVTSEDAETGVLPKS